eukprot:11155295-Lingulodinium_polyedra.AAC.1
MIWHHKFYNEPRAAPEEHVVPLGPKADCRCDTFNVLARYAATKADRPASGCVGGAGDGVSHAVSA